MFSQRGQAYLIALIVITLFVFAFFFLSGQGPLRSTEQPNKSLFENIQNEMGQSYVTAIQLQDIPLVMGGTATLFKNHSRSAQHELELCFTAFDQNNSYYYGNYSNGDGNASAKHSSVFVRKNSVKSVEKQSLLNDFNLSFCGQSFNLRQEVNVFIKLKRGKGVIQWQNRA